jgi:WD40 repeat protein
VLSAVFSPDGRLIVSASADKTIRIWDSRSGDTVLGPLEGHQHAVYFAVFSADGWHILSCSRDGTILVWDSETGERVHPFFEGESAKLSFTNSETAPYIITPPRSNMPVQGTSASSYSFSLENGVVGGVVNSSVDTWLYANLASNILIGRYTGQLMLIFL